MKILILWILIVIMKKVGNDSNILLIILILIMIVIIKIIIKIVSIISSIGVEFQLTIFMVRNSNHQNDDGDKNFTTVLYDNL